jgi:hypothetical protein
MTHSQDRLWAVAEAVTDDSRMTRSTMMRLPCLRGDEKFFACLDRRNGDLVIKLSKARVDELIAEGKASSFAPAGRQFKEWATISVADEHLWAGLLTEAQRFASGDS